MSSDSCVPEQEMGEEGSLCQVTSRLCTLGEVLQGISAAATVLFTAHDRSLCLEPRLTPGCHWRMQESIAQTALACKEPLQGSLQVQIQ